MIRLIVSDVDGTLAPEGAKELDPHLFYFIKELQKRGIRFAAASGRQYESVLNVFLPIRNEIFIIADNGAYIVEAGNVLASNVFSGDTWKSIIRYIRKIPQSHFMISSMSGSYTESKNRAFLHLLADNYAVHLKYAQDVTALDLRVSKIGLYLEQPEKMVPGRLAEEGKQIFGSSAHVVASGSCWVDFVAPGTDKGNALRKLQKMLRITPEETMAFGDNHNDLEMLRCAVESYAVPGAPPLVREAAKHVLPAGPEENGVLHMLEHVVQEFDQTKNDTKQNIDHKKSL